MLDLKKIFFLLLNLLLIEASQMYTSFQDILERNDIKFIDF